MKTSGYYIVVDIYTVNGLINEDQIKFAKQWFIKDAYHPCVARSGLRYTVAILFRFVFVHSREFTNMI